MLYCLFGFTTIFMNKTETYLAGGQFVQWKVRKHGKALKYKFMFIMLDNSWCFSQKISWRRDRNLVMVQGITIVTVLITRAQVLFPGIYPVANAGLTRLERTSTEWPIVHFTRIVEPHFRM